MKNSRRLLWFAVILLGGLGVLVVLLAQPRIQTSIVSRVLANQSGPRITFERIDIGLGAVAVTHLTLVDGPLKVRVPALLAEVPIWSLWGTSPHIERLEAKGWELQWDGSVADSPASVKAPARVSTAGWTAVLATLDSEEPVPQDILAQISTALDTALPVSVGQIELSGNATWRDAGPGADGQAQVSLIGTGPTPGAATELVLEVTAMGVSSSSDDPRIQSLEIKARINSEFDASRRPVAVEFESLFNASRPNHTEVDSYGLNMSIDQREGTPRLQLALRDAAQELFAANLAANAESALLTGEWTMKLSDVSVRHLMLGRDVPEFSLSGIGVLRATSRLEEMNLAGDLEFEILDVSQLSAAMAGVSDLSGDLGFEVLQVGRDTRFIRMDLNIAGAAPVLEARLLQGIEIGADRDELRVAQPNEPVIACQLLGLPLSWIQPAIEPWVVDARPIEGQIVGMVTPRGLRFITSDPIKIEGMAVANRGQSYVDEMDLEIDLGSEITTEGWQVELGRVEVFGEQGRLINLQARGGRLKRDDDIMKLVGRVDADLAGLSAWPGLGKLGELNRGRLQAEFGVGVEDRLSVATAISVTELETHSGQTIPAVDLDGRVDFRPDGSLELHLPIEITADDRTSDLTFNLRAESSAADWKLEGSLTGPKIHLQDIQALSALTGPTHENETITLGSDARHPNLSPVQANPSRAIWTGVSGSIQAAVGEIVVEGSPILSRFAAEMLIGSEALEIKGLSLGIGAKGEVTIDGRLTFDGTAPHPYLASATVVASDVAVEPWLRWVDPDSVPILEGNVDLNANWSAQVSDLAALSYDGQITAQLSSTGGVLRALGVDVDDYVKTGQTVAALGALFGAVTGNEKLTQQAQLVQSATRVAERLSLVEFDQLNLNLERQAAGDVVISDLSLISPALRLIGDGRINYREGLAFWLQPLALRMDLSAREDLGLALTRLGLLKSEADALGYLPLVTDFTLDGSLANIGTKELERLLVRAFTGR